ncbi:MORN repeat-containing protein [Cellulosilyticum ruminicola]|uniref:hypothetical protein n=1 Tax=Cellulosilyticum ruminicola TaxID=425254 RepID=UPI0006CF3040|nr:hypothetical protein [Cellulosilyticum ruminicola]
MKDFLGIMPTSEEDYITIGNWMIAKKVVMLFIILLSLLGIGYFVYIGRAIPVSLEIVEKVFYYNDNDLETYTGQAKILKSVNGKDQVVYKGDIVEGKCTGHGKVYDLEKKLIYEGELVENSYEGKGTLYGANGMHYEGDFVAGRKEGQGKLYNKNNELIYEGQFSKNLYDGIGTLYNKITGEWYTGAFKEGVKEGAGVLYNKKSQVIFEGTYKNNLFSGEALRYWNNKYMYVGNYTHGQREGMGKEYNQEGQLVYEGMLSMGKRHGQGIEYDGMENNKVYEGEFLQGLRQGKGILYDAAHKAIVEGQFFKGQIDYNTYLGEKMPVIQEVFKEKTGKYMADLQNAYFYPEAGIAIITRIEAQQEEIIQLEKVIKVEESTVVEEALGQSAISDGEGIQDEIGSEEGLTSENEVVEKIIIFNKLEELPEGLELVAEGNYGLNFITSLEGKIVSKKFIDFNKLSQKYFIKRFMKQSF